MQISKIGLMTPGDMGQAVAMQIQAQGFTVCTALEQRSERSRTLAREAGLTDVGSLARLLAECDVVLSVMNPGAALDFARNAAAALRASGITPKVFQGAADIYSFVAETTLGKENPEAAREHSRNGMDVVRALAQQHSPTLKDR